MAFENAFLFLWTPQRRRTDHLPYLVDILPSLIFHWDSTAFGHSLHLTASSVIQKKQITWRSKLSKKLLAWSLYISAGSAVSESMSLLFRFLLVPFVNSPIDVGAVKFLRDIWPMDALKIKGKNAMSQQKKYQSKKSLSKGPLKTMPERKNLTINMGLARFPTLRIDCLTVFVTMSRVQSPIYIFSFPFSFLPSKVYIKSLKIGLQLLTTRAAFRLLL